MSENKKMERDQWLFFVLAVALLPPFFNILATFLLGGLINFETMLGNGELLIAALAVAADAAGEGLGVRQRRRVSPRRKEWASRCTGICVVLAIIIGMLYGVVAATHFSSPGLKHVDPNILGWLSIAVFAGAAIAGYFPRLGWKG